MQRLPISIGSRNLLLVGSFCLTKLGRKLSQCIIQALLFLRKLGFQFLNSGIPRVFVGHCVFRIIDGIEERKEIRRPKLIDHQGGERPSLDRLRENSPCLIPRVLVNERSNPDRNSSVFGRGHQR